MYNSATLIGNLGHAPEVRTIEGGQKVAKFSLATSETYKKDGETITSTEWHSIVAWRQLADVAERFLVKGSQVAIIGKITHRKYTDKDGNTRYQYEVIADKIRLLGKRPDGEQTGQQTQERYNAADHVPGNDMPDPDNVRDIGEIDDLPF